MEAANFAIRFYEPAKKFYQRKVAKHNVIVARKALAHKLPRASYYVMRDHVPLKVYGTAMIKIECNLVI